MNGRNSIFLLFHVIAGDEESEMIPAKFSVLVVVVYKADATVFELPIEQFDELFHAIGVFIGRVDELFDDACMCIGVVIHLDWNAMFFRQNEFSVEVG